MDKFRSVHGPQKGGWTAVRGEIKKEKPKAFQKKLKKILHEAGIISNTRGADVKNPQAGLIFNRSAKVQSVVETEVSDRTGSILLGHKKKKRRRKGNDNPSAGSTNGSGNFSGKTTAHRTEGVGERVHGQFVTGSSGENDNSLFYHQKNRRGNESSVYGNTNVSPGWMVESVGGNMSTDGRCNWGEQSETPFIGPVAVPGFFETKRPSKKQKKQGSHSVTSNVKIGSYENENEPGMMNTYSAVGSQDQLAKQSADLTGNMNVVDVEVKQTHSAKKKQKTKDNISRYVKAPLVIEMDPGSSIEAPSILQEVADVKEDPLELALKEFYSSLATEELSGPDKDVPNIETQENKSLDTSVCDVEVETVTLFDSDLETSHQQETSFISEVDIESSSVNSSEMGTYSGFMVQKMDVDGDSVIVHKLPQREQFLLLMKHPNAVFFKGRLAISVLMGAVEVLGCVLNKDTNSKQTLWSPKGSSLLSIETCTTSQLNSLDYETMNENLAQFGVELSRAIIADVEKRDCVLLLEAPPVSPLENFFNTLPSHLQLFKFFRRSQQNARDWQSGALPEMEETLECEFKLSHTATRFKRYQKGLDWYPLVADISTGPMCTVVCGGNGVGKSTFLRFLINQLLPIFGQVLCLDFDPGQSEFTVPGCVSAVVIKEPLMGPNFTHLATPERMVNIGEVNISQCPVQYVKSVRYLISFCHSKPELMNMPCVVNTMGFSKGVGVDLTTCVIRLLKPNHVIQIQSSNAANNFPQLLEPWFVHTFESRFCNRTEPPDYVLHPINSMAEDKTKSPWNMTAAALRDAMILSYLSQMVKPPKFSLTDLVPHTTPFSKLILCVCHEKVPYSQILSAMNGNLVALCSYDGKEALVPDDPELPSVLGNQPVCPCLGFGIVRGIDMDKKQLFLLTPLPENLLSEVNCLMLGAVTLPNCVNSSANDCEGQIPYMATGPGQPTSRVARRFFRPLQRVRGNSKRNVHRK